MIRLARSCPRPDARVGPRLPRILLLFQVRRRLRSEAHGEFKFALFAVGGPSTTTLYCFSSSFCPCENIWRENYRLKIQPERSLLILNFVQTHTSLFYVYQPGLIVFIDSQFPFCFCSRRNVACAMLTCFWRFADD